MTLTLPMDVHHTEVGAGYTDLDEDSLGPFDPLAMDGEFGEMEQEHDYLELLSQLENHQLQSSWEVMSQHKPYFLSFLKTHSVLLKGDGPLAAPLRHYIAIMAASCHSCSPLVENHKQEMMSAGGSMDWLEQGLAGVTTKIQRLGEINKILAHQPWTITQAHIEAITRSGTPGNWSLSELVYAIVLMAHFHSFSSFIESCVSMEDGSTKSTNNKAENATRISPNQEMSRANTPPFDCSSPPQYEPGWPNSPKRHGHKGSKRWKGKNLPDTSPLPPYDCTSQPKISGGSPGADRVDSLVQKMQQLRSKPEVDSDELEAHFAKVEKSSAEINRGDKTSTFQHRPDISKYLVDPNFTYVDFGQRERKNEFPTFRVQDYNWDEEGFSLMSRFYDDIAQLLDDKFKTAYNLTYGTMGRLTAVDTSMFRQATWNYIQCLYGIRWDDYDYAEVNDLLHRSLKKYIKTAACYPERCALAEYASIMTDFQPSEKIHVCLLVAEAKFQTELLYALRAVAAHFRS